MPINKDRRNRVNEQIRFSPILLIDENGNKIGIISNRDALARARAVDLDLVEVSPDDRPPVCRIMDFGKFKYEQSIKEKKNKSTSKVKEVWFRPSIGEADIQTKIRAIREFIIDGCKVFVKLRYKARENAHRDLGFQVVKKVVDSVVDVATASSPKMDGNSLSCTLEPKKN